MWGHVVDAQDESTLHCFLDNPRQGSWAIFRTTTFVCRSSFIGRRASIATAAFHA